MDSQQVWFQLVRGWNNIWLSIVGLILSFVGKFNCPWMIVAIVYYPYYVIVRQLIQEWQKNKLNKAD